MKSVQSVYKKALKKRSLMLIGPVVSLTIIDREAKKDSRGYAIKNIILALLGFLLSAITIWYSGTILASINSTANFVLTEEVRRMGIWLGLMITGIALLTPVLLFFTSKWISLKWFDKKAQSIPAWLSLVFGSLAVFLFIISLWLFSGFAYPYIPPAFGGNAPTKVQIVLSEYLSDMENFPIKNNHGISEPVALIDQTPTSILIMLPDSSIVIEIPNSEIKGIIH
ncbi:MAG: hypothetical protein HZB18_14875 [Chloroflexi bacterium]|nr:hypothetical protein [Chloroflexota bacterium]